MGQSYATGTPPETTAQQLQAYIQYLPGLLQTTANQTLPVGQTEQNAQNILAPQQQQLQNQLYSQNAPGLYNTGNQLNALQSQAGISQALGNLNSSQGQQLSQAAITADQQANPQYYAALNQAGGQLSNLLGSINLGGLTGSETAQVQRGLAQQDAQKGITNSPSQTAAVSNAMNFGTALQAKQANLANAINTATSFLPASRTGVNTFAVGSGQSTTQSNPGASQFLGVNANNAASSASSGNQAQGSNLLSNITSGQNNANSLISAQGINNSIPSYLGSIPSVS